MRCEELEAKETNLINEVEEIFDRFRNTKNEKEKIELAMLHDDKVLELREVQKLMKCWLL